MGVVTRYPDDALNSPESNYEARRGSFRLAYGRCHPDGVEPTAVSGWIRASTVFGFGTANMEANASTIRRSHQDVRRDGADHYIVLFHVGGKTKLFDHNNQAERVAPGNVVLCDGARPFIGAISTGGHSLFVTYECLS